MQTNNTLLIIMDGWGNGDGSKADAMANAKVDYVKYLMHTYPTAQLITHGEQVGLPDGQMGNSEVGHLNLGAGRIVYQELERINVAIKTKELDNNKTLLNAIDYSIKNDKPFHLMGLVSDGGVHSHINHLLHIIQFLHQKNVQNIIVHAFTDGRDTDPKSGLIFIKQLLTLQQTIPFHLASITGRYYAMDRDKRWERVKLAYDALVSGKTDNPISTHPIEAITNAYSNNITDEFIKPILFYNKNKQISTIQKDDVVFCFNFRTDRCREITQVLTQDNMPDHNMQTLPLYYLTMTEYDKNFKGVKALFTNDNLENTLGEVLAKNNKTQMRIAETEKYPHVTFFFNGGREKPFDKEERILIPSPKVATYDLMPEMSAIDIKDAVIASIKKQFNNIVVNFANADMVGHTGVFSAAVKAVETVNNCVKEIVPCAIEHQYNIIILADHGNADYMINEDGSPNTAHTKNTVPVILITNDNFKTAKIKNGKLGDIAPTLLSLMKIDTPNTMTGNNLLFF